jgi:hypothetical protein
MIAQLRAKRPLNRLIVGPSKWFGSLASVSALALKFSLSENVARRNQQTSSRDCPRPSEMPVCPGLPETAVWDLAKPAIWTGSAADLRCGRTQWRARRLDRRRSVASSRCGGRYDRDPVGAAIIARKQPRFSTSQATKLRNARSAAALFVRKVPPRP